MKLQDLLRVAEDNQEVTVMIGGEGISGSADGLYTWLCNQALESVVEEMRAEDNTLKIWVDEGEEK